MLHCCLQQLIANFIHTSQTKHVVQWRLAERTCCAKMHDLLTSVHFIVSPRAPANTGNASSPLICMRVAGDLASPTLVLLRRVVSVCLSPSSVHCSRALWMTLLQWCNVLTDPKTLFYYQYILRFFERILHFCCYCKFKETAVSYWKCFPMFVTVCALSCCGLNFVFTFTIQVGSHLTVLNLQVFPFHSERAVYRYRGIVFKYSW